MMGLINRIKPLMILKYLIPILFIILIFFFFLFSFRAFITSDDSKVEIDFDVHVFVINIKQHLVNKHKISKKINDIIMNIKNAGNEDIKLLAELMPRNPVSQYVDAFPGCPYVTICETTCFGDKTTKVIITVFKNRNNNKGYYVYKKHTAKDRKNDCEYEFPISESEIKKLLNYNYILK